MTQNAEITIVPMTREHLAEAASLERASFSVPWSEAMIREELENPCAQYVVAHHAGAFLGYAGMQCVLDEGYVTNIAVDPAHRRAGVGSALLKTLLAIANVKALSFLSLEVRESNHPAIGLYTRFGFALAGRRRGYYTCPVEDALILTKTLGDRDDDNHSGN